MYLGIFYSLVVLVVKLLFFYRPAKNLLKNFKEANYLYWI